MRIEKLELTVDTNVHQFMEAMKNGDLLYKGVSLKTLDTGIMFDELMRQLSEDYHPDETDDGGLYYDRENDVFYIGMIVMVDGTEVSSKRQKFFPIYKIKGFDPAHADELDVSEFETMFAKKDIDSFLKRRVAGIQRLA